MREPRVLEMTISTHQQNLCMVAPVTRASVGPVEGETENVLGRDSDRENLFQERVILFIINVNNVLPSRKRAHARR